MSLWQQRTDDPVSLERRKKALVCAVLSYFLYLVIVIISFQPTKKTVHIVVPAGGSALPVRWSGQARRPGSGRGGCGHRMGIGVRHGRKAHAPSTANGGKKIVVNGGAADRQKEVKAVSQKSFGQKKEEKGRKGAVQPKVPVKKDAKIATKSVPASNKHDVRPVIAEKEIMRPPVAETPVKKPTEKQVQQVLQPEQKVEKRTEKREEPKKEVPKVCEEVPERGEPVAQEQESDLVEIGVVSEDLTSSLADEAEDGDESDDEDDASSQEISRDEYALMCAIGRAWRPPRGLKAGLTARLVVSISTQGRAERVDIVTSSQVPAYDIAARASLYRASFPHVFWGKNIAVVFG